MNMTSQLLRPWLTFHQMIVNRIAQTNTTMSRQLPSVGLGEFQQRPALVDAGDHVVDANVDDALQFGATFDLFGRKRRADPCPA